MAEVGEMISSPSLNLLFACVRLAGHSLAVIRDIAQGCRPEPSVHSHYACLSQENPRVVTLVQFAFNPPVQVSHQGLRFVEDHSTMAEFLGAGKSFSELGKASANGSPR